jgi:hypothetical protein
MTRPNIVVKSYVEIFDGMNRRRALKNYMERKKELDRPVALVDDEVIEMDDELLSKLID